MPKGKDPIFDEQETLDALNASLTEAGQPKLPTEEEEDEEDKKKDEEEEEEENKIDKEENDDKGDDKELSLKRGIPAGEFNKVRSQLRDKEKELEEANKKLEDFKNSVVNVDDNIVKETAKKMLPENASEEQIKATESQVRVLLESMEKKLQPFKDEVQSYKGKIEEAEQEKAFIGEWNSFEGDLKVTYSKATRTQLKEAQEAMDSLAHSEKFADKELDYILFKNKDIFDEIFKERKTKTFESQDTFAHKEDNNEDEDMKNFNPSKSSIDKVLKFHEKLQKEAAKEDEESGWNINNPTVS